MNARTLEPHCKIVAGPSANHDGDVEHLEDTVHAMADADADAIKLQTYRPESLILDLDVPHFGPRSDGPWSGLFGRVARQDLVPGTPLAWGDVE